ncbi:MAG: hypothetical protein JNM18_02655 [Planctomycetaceae bacterium]|nr:hypothetical protein [Planctomycetaceae bacterium]
MIALVPLFAAGDWVQVVIFLVFLVIAGINQMIKNAREKQAMRPPRPPQPENDVRGKIESELEAFLRRAQGKPPQPTRPEPPTPAAAQPSNKNKNKPSKKARRQAAMGEVVAAETVESKPRPRLEPRLQQHIDTSRFDERAKHLTNIAHEADDIDSHVHNVFDHQLGSLGGRAHVQSDQAAVPVDAEAPPATAAAISALLADPAALKQAIILQEILSRPTHRW